MTLLYAIGGIAALVILLVLLILSRIKVAGPNQAFLVTGRQGRQVTSESGVISRDSSGQKVVMGASVFVVPRSRPPSSGRSTTGSPMAFAAAMNALDSGAEHGTPSVIDTLARLAVRNVLRIVLPGPQTNVVSRR